MAAKRKTGTRIIFQLFFIITITILLLVAVASIPRFVKIGERAIRDRQLSNDGIVLIHKNDPRSDGAVGETVSERQFIEVMYIGGGTTLMKESFIKSANGKTVTWRFQVHDIKFGKDGNPTGDFLLRYELRNGNSSNGSSASFEVHFLANQTDQLVKLRRDDIVTVTGTLNFNKNSRQITDAKLVSEGNSDLASALEVEQE